MLQSPSIRLEHQLSVSVDTVTDPRTTPARWGEARLYEYDSAVGRLKCRVCSQYCKIKYAEDEHVLTSSHTKWEPLAAQFIPELAPEVTGHESQLWAIEEVDCSEVLQI